MTHGKHLVAPATTANPTISVEGTAVTMNLTSGYPSAVGTAQATALATAAGLSTADYTVYVTGSGATRPTVVAGEFAVVPNSIANTKTAATCFVLYKTSTTANTPPTISVGSPTSTASVAACE
jgi:MSHA pilin protein MshA